MRAGKRGAVASLLIVSLATTAAGAAPRRAVDVAPGPLDRAIVALGRQTDIEIGATDPALAGARTRGVKGELSPREALRRLLAGTGFRAVPLGGDSYRLAAAPVRTAPVGHARAARQPPPPPGPGDIVVVASKRAASLLRFPGAVNVPKLGSDGFGTGDTRDLHAIVGTQPILQGTELGDGRNKLFVRGIADSSFVGPTRSTASVYFDEAQLGYNGADPNLNLYDIDHVEVLEGPQGALYGAGSIGGIVRILPHMPDAGGIAASTSLSVAATRHGGISRSGAAMVNLPLARDLLALRVVGYAARDAGYIDDSYRHLSDVNRSRTLGARATLRLTPGDDWTIDVGGLAQENRAPDTQYALRGLPSLTRASIIAQPFEGDFALAQLVVRKTWDSGLQLVSSTAVARHHSDDRFDATARARPTAPIAYDTHDRNRMTMHEMRLSRSVANGDNWLIGLSYIDDLDRIQRELGAPGRPQDIVGVTNQATDLSAFGEGTIAISPALSLTAGGRLTRARTNSDPAFVRRDTSFIPGLKSFRLSPMLAASVLLAPRLAWYTRYDSGFRTGGLAVAPGVGRVANFQPDTIHVLETGLRLQRGGDLGLSATVGISSARWAAIQADLVDRRGFPYATNIGNGRIRGLEATADWVPVRAVTVDGALFFNASHLTDPVAALTRQQGDDLADTPRFAASGRVTASWANARGQRWTVAGTALYTGHSYVGFGPMLDIGQGGYAAFGASADWRAGAFAVGLNVDNVADSAGNRFSLGNPFTVADRNQITPLRPRTVRLTLTWRTGP